jgi:hypothetical protein
MGFFDKDNQSPAMTRTTPIMKIKRYLFFIALLPIWHRDSIRRPPSQRANDESGAHTPFPKYIPGLSS